ncbi:MAG: hypothetical protein RR942_06605 [Romboutsia sp.]
MIIESKLKRYIGCGLSLDVANQYMGIDKEVTKVFVNKNTLLYFLHQQYNSKNYHKAVLSYNMRWYEYLGKLVPIKVCEEIENGYILFMDKNNKIIGYIRDDAKKGSNLCSKLKN